MKKTGDTIKLKENLPVLMEQHQLTVARLAALSKIPRSTLNEWLNGASPRDLSQLRDVARYFDVSLEDLLFGKDIALSSDFWKKGKVSGVFRISIERISDE